MATANERLLDEAIRHQVDFAKYSNNVVRRIIAALNRSDVRLFEELTLALERLDPDSFTVERLESLLSSVRSINAQAYVSIGAELRQELRDFTIYEASYQAQALRVILPVQVHVASISAEQAYAAAMARPFQGTLLKGALDHLEAEKSRKIRQAIAQGFTEGKTTSQIVREIRGTRALKYTDGLMEGSRRDIETIVRTALSHTAGVARDRFYEANSDLIKAVVWRSTLDSRTSQTCLLRDGKQYTNDTHKPIGHSLPWLGGPGRAHYGCRSTGVPALKSYRELGLDIDDFTPSTRASLDGQVPADLSYGEWLKKQSTERQDDIMGTTRGKLLREGGLAVDRFANDKGKWLTLDELRERDAEAFKRAGL